MNEKHGIIIGIFVLGGIISLLFSPLFHLTEIKVKGLQILEKDEVVNSSLRENYEGDNIFLLNRKKIRDIILDNPYIKEVSVGREFPSGLQVEVEERVPLAKINNNGSFLVFDHSGVILEKGSQNTRFDVPELKGLGYSFSGDRLEFSSSLSHLVQALKQVDFDNRLQLEEFEWREDNFNGEMKENIEIFLGGEESLDRKFDILNSTIKKINSEKLSVDYIDLKSVSRPVIKIRE
ncbi:MAG: cell division protein FtsQ/DivIB [Halanaerobiaceae bacterium]